MSGKITNIEKIAQNIFNSTKNLVLIYGFNGTGKTRLSVAFKDLTKKNNGGNHSGVYYNAYSEDLFYWDNDEENSGENIRLKVHKSSLNQFHSLLDEENLRSKLHLYKPKYGFEFETYEDVSQGIKSIRFFLKNGNALQLANHRKDVFLYHLELLQTIKKAVNNNKLYAFHFALLRQILESISSFLGVGRISFVLEQIGITDADEVARITNTLSHKNVFRYEAKEMVEDNKLLFKQILTAFPARYRFELPELIIEQDNR